MPGGLTGFRNAEDWYQNPETQKRVGARPITTTNFGGLSKLSSISNLLLHHPLFGNLALISQSIYIKVFELVRTYQQKLNTMYNHDIFRSKKCKQASRTKAFL